MRILFIGDVIGRPGRDVLATELPQLRKSLKLDFVIINGENLAGGFGVTRVVAVPLSPKFHDQPLMVPLVSVEPEASNCTVSPCTAA